MSRVLLYSVLLVVGLLASQLLPGLTPGAFGAVSEPVRLLTMVCLGFIMIHVGHEFVIDRRKLRGYAVDYGVAATAAAVPWILATLYFVFVMAPETAGSFDGWARALLAGRFAAPTSAGILFSMLAAAGLSATWLYRKARILAIFDDLDTVLLMIPLKMLLIGVRWQLAVVVLIMAVLVWVAWRYMHQLRLPTSWPWVLGYASVITAVSELIYRGSKAVDVTAPIHIEVLLPAFVLGAVLTLPRGHDAPEAEVDPESPPAEARAAHVISAVFMVLVGLSVPVLQLGGDLTWTAVAGHTLALTVLSNVGKMFPLVFYRKEASLRERLAVSIAMWPRGEVGAGVLAVSLAYGISPAFVTVATLSLALNLLLTGVFIVIVKRLIEPTAMAQLEPVGRSMPAGH